MKENKKKAQEKKSQILAKKVERDVKTIDSRKVHDTQGKGHHERRR